ncbi:eCIS core domain-containing protein [Streptomyces murinus]|uniref:eCIS core domain-containing protein n=1 Tax=Streptomyces murinus TaxID=33900 RepID=UPI0036E9EFAF
MQTRRHRRSASGSEDVLERLYGALAVMPDGAKAMTVGHRIFLSAGATAEEKLIGRELSHVDKNLKGLPETGHSNGAGITVTDPR